MEKFASHSHPSLDHAHSSILLGAPRVLLQTSEYASQGTGPGPGSTTRTIACPVILILLGRTFTTSISGLLASGGVRSVVYIPRSSGGRL
jgi:hypothetical protein